LPLAAIAARIWCKTSSLLFLKEEEDPLDTDFPHTQCGTLCSLASYAAALALDLTLSAQLRPGTLDPPMRSTNCLIVSSLDLVHTSSFPFLREPMASYR
jgi:hypothetical protein